MDLVDRIAATSFIGKEFLTWLWFRSDTDEGLVDIGDGGPAAELWLTDRLVLSGTGQGAEHVAVRTEEPTDSYEARTALRRGKKVEQVTLRLVRGQREWTVTVKGETLAVSSIKIPAVLTKEEDDRQRERLVLLDQLDEMLASLYARFIALRLDAAAWQSECESMVAWVQGETA